MRATSPKKISISVKLPKEQVDWIDKKIKEKVYRNRPHAVEVAIEKLIKNDKKRRGGTL